MGKGGWMMKGGGDFGWGKALMGKAALAKGFGMMPMPPPEFLQAAFWGGKGGGGGGCGGGGGGGGHNNWETIPGLTNELTAALSPIAERDAEPGFVVDDWVRKIRSKIEKASAKYTKDDRAKSPGTATAAKLLIEEFVDHCMSAMSSNCYEKPWFQRIDFTATLLVTVLHTFANAKIFNRTLGPNIERYIEEGIFRWAEEERLTKAMWDAVAAAGVVPSHQKKANQHLAKAYDEAHLNSPYGTTQAASPELALLQDFVKGWMTEFCSKAWDCLENGTGEKHGKDEQVLFVTVLFQHLLDPTTSACVPHEIVQAVGELPPAPWPFIAQAAEDVVEVLHAPPVPGMGKRRKLF